MNKLLEINRLGIYKKLDSVTCIKVNNEVLYKCNDVIDAISDAKVRDKRLINDYGVDIMVLQCRVGKRLISCRFFNTNGIKRYLNEGKIYDYQNACSYFKIEPRDLEKEKLNKELTQCGNNTKKLLKWLYEKRKCVMKLGDVVNYKELVKWIEDNDEMDNINLDKFNYLKCVSDK
jgi:hypothetical protein